MTSRKESKDDDSAHSSSRSSTLDEDSIFGSEPPSISQIYKDASRYEKVLICGGCMRRSSTGSSDGSVECFTERVGKDLSATAPTQEVHEVLAKLAVTGETLTPSDTSSDSEADLLQTESPESDEAGFDAEDLQKRLEDAEDKPDELRRSSTTDGESWRIPAVEVVDLLIQEFGSLTLEGNTADKEHLILETDAALFQDVVIIGVVHVTDHRLAFHASLLDTRPNLHPSRQVIKSGSAVIHRKGFHTKRRVWLTLSHDMICAYASSREEDKIRPLRTVLLSQVKEVLPVDPKSPRRVNLIFDAVGKAKSGRGVVEFDTEESAADWRNELQGTHSRRQALTGSQTEESDGVRLSIPLNRISHYNFEQCLYSAHILTLHVQLSNTDVNNFTLGDTGKQESTVVQIITMRPEATLQALGSLIEKAKAHHPPGSSEMSNVFVDFGPLSFFEEEEMGYVKDPATHGKKEHAVRNALALQAEPQVWIVRARIFRGIASSGYFALSPHFLGFWSKSCTRHDLHYRLRMSSIKKAKQFSRKILCVNGLALEIEGHRDLRFDFKTPELRDEAIRRITATLETVRGEVAQCEASQSSSKTHSSSIISTSSRSSTPTRSATGIFSPLARTFAAVAEHALTEERRLKLPKAINIPRDSLASLPSKHFVCLTIGSRGDVQPYIALGLALQKEGHRVTIVTHSEYGEWIKGFGIEHRIAGGDPGALMKLSVENKMFSPEFFKESLTNFRPWLDQLLQDSWEQCQGADVLLESPSAMAGVHIAEALNIPYFRTFTMPWTKTSSFPHAMLSPPVEAPSFNSASYVLFDNVMWTATSSQINRWRRHSLKIGNTDMGHLAQSKITFIYNFSQAVVPKPLDWKDNVIVTGYWFLDNPDLNWTPPISLMEWMAKAKLERKPIVYIGFGSVTVPHPRRVTKHIVEAVLKSDVRAIISKGWSARMAKHNEPEVEMPEECYSLDKVPHDWLFPQIDAAMHHGGAGTTGASLRAGIPTLIRPWFGDQYFWASRVQKLGAGLKVASLSVNDIASALTKATTNRLMKEKAAAVGERIRSEDGAHDAIHAIYTYFTRASQDRTSLD